MNEQLERVAYFGKFAGFAAANIALSIWAQKSQKCTRPFKIQEYYTSIQEAISDTYNFSQATNMKRPMALIIGGSGHCGQGVIQLLQYLNFDWVQWGKKEMTSSQNLLELLNYDILFNCISLKHKTVPFFTIKQLQGQHRLSLIMDVSCIELQEYNPLPIYNGPTTFKNPTHLIVTGAEPMDLVAIHNLPSLIPYESSLFFSGQLLPHLKQFLNNNITYPWKAAKSVFNQNMRLLASLR